MYERTYPPEPYGRLIGPLAFGYDPQNAPTEYVEVVRRFVDVDGTELVLLRDQDGEEWAMDAADYDA